MKGKSKKKNFTLVGNWKMNPDTLENAKDLISAYDKKVKKLSKVSVIICPPAPFMSFFGLKKLDLILGAQDVDHRPKGSFTSCVSAVQMKNSGAKYTIIGHNDRRLMGDSDEIIAEKTLQAINAGLKVILCVGEKVRDQNAEYLESIKNQIKIVVSKIDKKKINQITIAYEPIWAIGKSYSEAMSANDIHEMSIFIKKVMSEFLGKDAGLKTQVLYGGSVNFENAQAILSQGEIDGLLIGRQSLEKDAFLKIMDYANNV